ncbi:MAG TPA: hypothetical protein VFD88_03395 [Clostridia bacterium]|nr:hypothetical protein [Clostridia bacterium]
MSVFLGWIIRKRWMTIAAFALTFIGAFTLPRLPSPASYTVLLPPVILVMAIIYEGSSLPRLTISSPLRLALALWMGFSVLVLMAGIVFASSSSAGLIATIAIFSVLAMAGVLTIGVLHRRQLRDVAKVRGSQPRDSTTPV